MTPLYTQEEFNNAKSKDKLPCECYYCKNMFFNEKHTIQRGLNPNSSYKNYFCSYKCKQNASNKKQNVNCFNCLKSFEKANAEIKRYPNHFCSRTCSTSYNNKNKTTGNRRSKLEVWLENQLIQLYPNLKFDFNMKSAIGSELDIYIPSLNLAFELNGIFHYEPIFGVNKLNQTQSNDSSKSKACFDKQIDLCIIDTSAQKYVKPATSQKYLNIIINIINERL